MKIKFCKCFYGGYDLCDCAGSGVFISYSDDSSEVIKKETKDEVEFINNQAKRIRNFRIKLNHPELVPIVSSMSVITKSINLSKYYLEKELSQDIHDAIEGIHNEWVNISIYLEEIAEKQAEILTIKRNESKSISVDTIYQSGGDYFIIFNKWVGLFNGELGFELRKYRSLQFNYKDGEKVNKVSILVNDLLSILSQKSFSKKASNSILESVESLNSHPFDNNIIEYVYILNKFEENDSFIYFGNTRYQVLHFEFKNFDLGISEIYYITVNDLIHSLKTK